jgi:hypothetical protein
MDRKESDDSLERYLLHTIQTELESKWKRAEECKSIARNASLAAELDKLPPHWIQAIAQQLGYLEPMEKADCVLHITHTLGDPAFLQRILVELSRSSLYILKCLLAKGGWSTFQVLSRQANTDESEDSWWWVDDPPTSPLGQLRVRGLVFVGRTLLKTRRYRVAVVPRELRELCRAVLPAAYEMKQHMSERPLGAEHFTPGDTRTYLELLDSVEQCFRRHLPDSFSVKSKQVIRFLERMRLDARPMQEIDQAWEDIQCLFAMVTHASPHKGSIAELRSWDFSYFVSTFIPSYYNESKLAYEEVKRILENLAAFLATVAENGELASDKEIRTALARIPQDDGKINRILRPRARGPEDALRVPSPRANKSILFTNNDLWMIVVLCLEYDEDWQAMTRALERGERSEDRIVDAAEKHRHLLYLRARLLEHGINPYKILWYMKPTASSISEAKRWFDKRKLVGR